MIKFQYNKETGILEAWENGKKKGEIITMGDQITQDTSILPDKPGPFAGEREGNSKKGYQE